MAGSDADGTPGSGDAGNGNEPRGLRLLRGEVGEWGERYVPEAHRRMLIEVEHLARYSWACGAAAGRTVLDAGCGMGYGAALLHAAGAAATTGVDVDEEALVEARRHFGTEVEFRRGDLAVLPLADAGFDLVTCFEVIEHVADQGRALDELRRVLTPEGVLIISSPNRGVYPSGNPWHLHEYTPEELEAELSERFANVSLFAQQPHLCSLISDRETAAGDEITETIDARVRKLGGTAHGAEQYTLAIASDGPLPELANTTVIGGGLDVKATYDALLAWEQRARRAEAERELEIMDRQRLEMIQEVIDGQVDEPSAGPVRMLLGRISRRLRATTRR